MSAALTNSWLTSTSRAGRSSPYLDEPTGTADLAALLASKRFASRAIEM
jgi:hypothetical protein